RLRFPIAIAGGAGVLLAGVVAALIDETLVGGASSLAGLYLAGAVAGAPPVSLSHAGVRAIAAAITAIDLGATVFFLSDRGARFFTEVRTQRFAYGAISPALLGLGVLVGLPFAFGIGMSFFEHEHGSFHFVGLANFAAILSPPDRPLFSPGSMLYALFLNVLWTAS